MRSRAIATFCAVLGAAGPSVAEADTAERADRAVAAFTEWLTENDTSGSLALVRDGEIVGEAGVGRAADARMELASVSKTITGVCAAELVSKGVLAWSDTTDMRLGGELGMTFGQLITHQSGLKQDSTQEAMLRWLDTPGRHKAPQVLDLIEGRGGATGAVDAYWYTNENFALAALMIEQASGRAYQDVCGEMAIAPAQVEASPSSRSGAFLPWGGWRMRPGDLALWHAHWFAGDADFARDPKSLPHAVIEDGLFYGTGSFFRTLSPGKTFWHFGAQCFPARLNAGSYAATVFADWTVVAAWDACLDWPAMAQVDQRVMGALFGDQ